MEQLINAFGIDIKLITAQIINFTILLAVLSYFLYKPILKVLADREEQIATGIKDAEAAAAARADAETEKSTILTAAHQEAEGVVDRAKTEAGNKAQTIEEDAAIKASAIISSAEAAALERKAQIEKESEREIAKVAILAAEKILAK